MLEALLIPFAQTLIPYRTPRFLLELPFQTISLLFQVYILQQNYVVKTIKLMAFISGQKYRGHVLCPCGSGQKLRTCHGPFIMKFFADNRLKAIVRRDYLSIEEAVRKYDEQQRNTRTAK